MQVTDDIPKPERDARLYRRVTFPNGLEALLISDPSLVRPPPPTPHSIALAEILSCFQRHELRSETLGMPRHRRPSHRPALARSRGWSPH